VTPGVPPGVGPHTETVRRADEASNGDDRAEEAKGQAQAKADEVKEQAQQKADEVKRQAQDKVNQVKQAAPEQIGQAASTIREQARQNPLPFAVGGALLAGFVIGRASKKF
jgi:F0F1-type ATP synthase membrane subunit b/b'